MTKPASGVGSDTRGPFQLVIEMQMARRHFGPCYQLEVGVAQFAGAKHLALPRSVAAAVFSNVLVDYLTRGVFNRGESAGRDTGAGPSLLFRCEGNLHGSLYHKLRRFPKPVWVA